MPTYAITSVTYQRRALFMRTANADLLLGTIFQYRDQGRYLLHGFAIMPEHIHVLLTPSIQQTIERCAQCIKGGFSHRVRDRIDFENQLAYIAANPERRKLVNYAYVHTNFPDKMNSLPPCSA